MVAKTSWGVGVVRSGPVVGALRLAEVANHTVGILRPMS